MDPSSHIAHLSADSSPGTSPRPESSPNRWLVLTAESRQLTPVPTVSAGIPIPFSNVSQHSLSSRDQWVDGPPADFTPGSVDESSPPHHRSRRNSGSSDMSVPSFYMVEADDSQEISIFHSADITNGTLGPRTNSTSSLTPSSPPPPYPGPHLPYSNGHMTPEADTRLAPAIRTMANSVAAVRNNTADPVAVVRNMAEPGVSLLSLALRGNSNQASNTLTSGALSVPRIFLNGADAASGSENSGIEMEGTSGPRTLSTLPLAHALPPPPPFEDNVSTEDRERIIVAITHKLQAIPPPPGAEVAVGRWWTTVLGNGRIFAVFQNPVDGSERWTHEWVEWRVGTTDVFGGLEDYRDADVDEIVEGLEAPMEGAWVNMRTARMAIRADGE